MNEFDSTQTSRTAAGAVTEAGEFARPSQEKPNYTLPRNASAYSCFFNQATDVMKRHPQPDFVHDMAAIYASLSGRQMRLGEEFESAVFEGLDSLYEP